MADEELADHQEFKSPEDEIILRDLQSLLRKSYGHELVLIEYSTAPLVSKGENFGSSIIKIDALVRKSESEDPEELHLVGKMMPKNKVQEPTTSWTQPFRKENFVFENLVPMYEKIANETRLENEKGQFKLLPKYFGARYSVNAEATEVDQDAVMLLENLKIRGYRTMSKIHGLNLEHAKMAIKALAKYHALGITCVQKYPDFASLAKSALNKNEIKEMPPEEFKKLRERLKTTLMQDPRVAPYDEHLTKGISYNFNDIFKEIEPGNIWSTFTHGDFWVNNMMFLHDDENDEHPLDIKFIDFQQSSYSTGLRDLAFFLCTSCSAQVIRNHTDELIKDYFKCFMGVLEKTGCETSAFTIESLEEYLRIEGSRMFILLLQLIKFQTLEDHEDCDLSDGTKCKVQSDVVKEFRERAYETVKLYVKRKWL